MAYDPTREEFVRQIPEHRLTVLLDSGVYRHLRLQKPGSSNRYFNINTWPGYLAISGDMGCYVFARLPDMFEFFRDHKGRINPSYWAEKLQADQKGSGHMEFSDRLYRQAAVWDFRAYYPARTDGRLEAWKDFREEMLDCFSPSSVTEAVEAVHSYVDPAGRSKFAEFYEHRLEDYTYHFIWCCHAIQWAIDRYDEHKADERFPGLARLHAEQNPSPSDRAVEPRKAA